VAISRQAWRAGDATRRSVAQKVAVIAQEAALR